jgi:hypothetical protein
MEKTTAAGLLRWKKSTARITVSALLSFLLFVVTAPFSQAAAHAAVKFNLLQGEERYVDIGTLFGASSLESADYDEQVLEILVDEHGVIFKAKNPTQVSVPVTLYMEGGNGQTVTEYVYVKIYHNNPPTIYDSEPYVGTVSLLPGDDNYLYIGLTFYDSDFNFYSQIPAYECTSPYECMDPANHKPETLTYVVEDLPSFVNFEVDHEFASIKFIADADAEPGVYMAKVYAVDIAGNRSEPGYVFIHIREGKLVPRVPVLVEEVFSDHEVSFGYFYEQFRYGGSSAPSGLISYFEIDHPYDEGVQVCEFDENDEFTCSLSNGKLEPGQSLRFTKPGVYDLSIVAVDQADMRSEPLFARFYITQSYKMDYWFGAPLLPIHDEFLLYGDEPGTLYIVPFQGEGITTAEQLEQLYNKLGGVKKESIIEYGEYVLQVDSNDLIHVKNISDRVSLYVVSGDGSVQYVKHFMLIDDENVTVNEILDYYKQPLYAADDQFILKLLLLSITPVSSWN